MLGVDAGAAGLLKRSRKTSKKEGPDAGLGDLPLVRHRIFVEDEEEMQSFQPHKYFDTHPALMSNKMLR